MSSIVELIFTAVGTEEVSRSVGKVNSGLGDMVGNLGRMATAALSVDVAWNKLEGAIREAAGFEHLAARTGENVRALVVLDQAFRNAGLGAEMIGMSANMLQRALGGVNDMGGRTDIAFRRIGTSIQELKPLSYAQQLDVLSKGFSNLANQSDRVAVARNLFGRGGGSMLQLLGDPDALARSEEQAGRVADRIKENARAAHDLEVAWSGVTANFRDLWQAAATQLLPTLKSIVELLGSVTSGAGGVGAFLGGAAPSLIGAGTTAALGQAIARADTALYAYLVKTKNSVHSAWLTGLSSALGAAADIVPFVIAGMIAKGILEGLARLGIDKRMQALVAHQNAVSAVFDPAAKAVGNVDSEQAAEKQRAAFQKDIEEKQARLEELNKTVPNLDDPSLSNYQLSKLRPKYAAQIEEISRLKEELTSLRKLEETLGDPVARDRIIKENQARKFNEDAATSVANQPLLQEKLDKLNFAAMTPQDQLANIASERGKLDADWGAIPAGSDPEAKEARRTEFKIKYAELTKAEEEANKRIDEATKQAASEKKKTDDEEQKRQLYALETQMEVAKAAGDEKLAQSLKEQIELKRASNQLSGLDLTQAKERYAAEHQIWEQEQAKEAAKKQREAASVQIDADKLVLENTLTSIRESIAKLDANYSRTEASKWAEKKVALAKEMDAVRAEIAKDEAQQKFYQNRGQPGDDTTAKLYGDSAAASRAKLGGLQRESGALGADPNNFLAQLTDKMTKVKQGFGSLQETIAGGFAQAFGNASAGLQKLIGDTQLWSAKLGNVAGPIMGAVTKAIADMFTTWVVNEVILAGLKKLFHEEDKKDTTEATAGKALEAGMKSIATLGPLWGPIAFAASAAAIYAIAGGFRKDGGPVSAGVPYVVGEGGIPEMFVPESNGYIFPDASRFAFSAPAPRAAGSGAAQAGAAMQPAANVASAGGGGRFAGGSRESARNIHLHFDRGTFAQAMQEDSTAYFRDIVAEMMRKNA